MLDLKMCGVKCTKFLRHFTFLKSCQMRKSVFSMAAEDFMRLSVTGTYLIWTTEKLQALPVFKSPFEFVRSFQTFFSLRLRFASVLLLHT